jgi:hypothetical protein
MRLSYGGLGPTEFRILLVIVNIAFMYIPWLSEWKRPVTLFHNDFMIGLFDYIAVVVSLLIMVFYLISFFKDAKYFSTIDPIKKPEDPE